MLEDIHVNTDYSNFTEETAREFLNVNSNIQGNQLQKHTDMFT